jgi:hypothetical protein
LFGATHRPWLEPLGTGIGAAAGVGSIAAFVGSVTPRVLGFAAAVALVGVVLTVLAALVPVAALGRIRMAALQAEE